MKRIFLLFLLVQLSLQVTDEGQPQVKQDRGLSLRKRSKKGKGRLLRSHRSRSRQYHQPSYQRSYQPSYQQNQGRSYQQNQRRSYQQNYRQGYQQQTYYQQNQNRFIDRRRRRVKRTNPSVRYRPRLHYPTEAVISSYDNMMVQINLQRASRFNTSSTNADYFVHKGGVYGFEWKNGMFIRQPFPTFQRVSDEFSNRVNGTALLVPLHNRYKPRKALMSQMDCALHMKIVEHTHFLHRFNRIILQFSSPCRPDPVEVILLNKAGLRKTLRLKIGPREFLINFRGIFKGNFVTNLEKESYSEYRLARPQHLRVNNLRMKYLNDFKKPLQGARITPEIMMTHNEAVLKDMEEYYQKNEDLLKGLDSSKELEIPQTSIAQNRLKTLKNDESPQRSRNQNISRNSTATKTPEQLQAQLANEMDADRRRRQQEYYERMQQWGLNYYEMSEIQSFFSQLRTQYREVLNMCKRICTQQEYYTSWDFCKETCQIDQYFLSNNESWDKNIKYLPLVKWSRLNGKYIRMATGNRNAPYWKFPDIERIWNSPPIITCRQTWTTFNCSI